MYKVNLETFNGSVKVISLPSKGAVAQFISTYPTQLPVGVSVKIACDTLGIRGNATTCTLTRNAKRNA